MVEENTTGSRREIIFVLEVGWKAGRCACLLYDNGGAARRCLLLKVIFNQALMNSISHVIHYGTMLKWHNAQMAQCSNGTMLK